MTLVMAYADPDTREITMVGDTHSFDGAGAYPNVKKIVRRSLVTPDGTDAGAVLIGYAGEAAVGITARNAKMPKIVLGTDPEVVIDRIAKSLQKYGESLPGGINYHGGTDQLWIVGWNGHVWEFVHYDVLDVRPFGAIGAGSSLAYGAWDTFGPPYDSLAAQIRMERIGQIVEHRHHKVRGPFQTEIISGLEYDVR